MHLPPWQLVEQQSPASAQASPRVLQALEPGSGWQALALQRPVQHSVPAPQEAEVALHTVPAQSPPTQESEQHSPALAQAAPGDAQKAVEVQVWVVVLQAVEQQPALPLSVQSVPADWQVETGTAQRLVEGLQYPSQHSDPAVQETPMFLQVGGGAQWSVPSQKPEQQSASALQLPGLAVQVVAAAHALGVPVQLPVQHSPPATQLAPLAWQGVAQVLVASQRPEQHSAPASQLAAAALHAGGAEAWGRFAPHPLPTTAITTPRQALRTSFPRDSMRTPPRDRRRDHGTASRSRAEEITRSCGQR